MPFGGFKNFGDCYSDTDMTKRYDAETRKKVCGALQHDLGGNLRGATKQDILTMLDGKKILSFEENGRVFIKSFIIDASVNGNGWGVTRDSIPRNITSAIGKPIVLSEDFNHPYLDDKDYNHALAYQDLFKVAVIIDVIDKGSGVWEQIAEVTDDGFKKALKEDPNLPFWVSPTIRLIGAQPDTAIQNWEVMHEAIVDRPAYGVKKAMINGQCSGDQDTCLLQLRKAHIEKHGYGNCGFCTYQAMIGLQNAAAYENWRACMADHMKGKGMSMPEAVINCSKIMAKTGAAIPEEYREEHSSHVTFDSKNNQDNIMSANEKKSQQTTSLVKAEGEKSNTNRAQEDKPKNLAQDQPVGEQPEGTSDKDFEEFKQKRQNERRQIDREEGKSASVDELLEQVKSLTLEKADLESKLKRAKSDNEALSSLQSQLSDRLGKLETEREEEHKRARLSEISAIVNGAAIYRDMSKEEREKQIDTFNASSWEVDKIKSVIAPLENNFRKASMNAGHSGNGYRSRVQLGGKVETKEASLSDDPEEKKPRYLQFAEHMLPNGGYE